MWYIIIYATRIKVSELLLHISNMNTGEQNLGR